ncbi:MAG: sulfite oxidase heme-binding subunit YedZ [Candidatus Eiseniibacteriota bacterium]
MLPWTDRAGRVVPLKAAVFAGLFLPGLWVAGAFYFGDLGARPVTEAIHQIGLWAIRFLFLSLAVTPLRQLWRWPKLVAVRRMIGVAAFFYAAIHLGLYTVDQMFDLSKVVSEIALRFYLTIGFVSLLGLAALAATSTDGMVRRLGGKKWQRLHQLVYLIAFVATIHFFLQSKSDVTEPTVMAGLGAWLLFYRLRAWTSTGQERWPVAASALLALGATAVTAGGEAVYYWLKMGVDPLLVLNTNLSLDAGIRPAMAVLVILASVVVTGAWRGATRRRKAPRLRPAYSDAAAE